MKEKELPFQTIELAKTRYKLFGVVTNRDLPGDELIHWHRKRCGASEQVHHVEKAELAGGQFPSNKFGANAAWWQMMVLAFNLNGLMKNLVLPETLQKKKMKGLRFHVICLAGRVIRHARRMLIKVSGEAGIVELLSHIRSRLNLLAHGPPICDGG